MGQFFSSGGTGPALRPRGARIDSVLDGAGRIAGLVVPQSDRDLPDGFI